MPLMEYELMEGLLKQIEDHKVEISETLVVELLTLIESSSQSNTSLEELWFKQGSHIYGLASSKLRTLHSESVINYFLGNESKAMGLLYIMGETYQAMHTLEIPFAILYDAAGLDLILTTPVEDFRSALYNNRYLLSSFLDIAREDDRYLGLFNDNLLNSFDGFGKQSEFYSKMRNIIEENLKVINIKGSELSNLTNYFNNIALLCLACSADDSKSTSTEEIIESLGHSLQ